MKKILLKSVFVLLMLYVFLCAALYFFQEKIIFLPEKLEQNHVFNFNRPFEELNVKSEDGTSLNGVLFKADSSNGLIFYLHGNAGSLDSWGHHAELYTALHYDVFMLDYRGYGKSEGEISNEEQLFKDNQTVYNELKKRHAEENIIVLGYSIGSGMAAKLTSSNHPKRLILQAPYYGLTDIMKDRFPFIPTFILKYKLATHEYLRQCKTPVFIFHGDQDQVINIESSYKLQQEFKLGDTLMVLKGQGHNGITGNEDYQLAIMNMLSTR